MALSGYLWDVISPSKSSGCSSTTWALLPQDFAVALPSAWIIPLPFNHCMPCPCFLQMCAQMTWSLKTLPWLSYLNDSETPSLSASCSTQLFSLTR